MSAVKHHPWCAPGHCFEQPEITPGFRDPRRYRHQGVAAQVAGSGGTVTSRIIQGTLDPQPRIKVAAKGWAHAPVAELTVEEAEDLIANLAEQVKIARAASQVDDSQRHDALPQRTVRR